MGGTFPALRRGDHCMTPLNLAQGVSAILDKIVDTVAGLEVTPYYHHFVVLDDVADLAAGEEAHVAEYTNTPDDFLITARKVGYSGAFMDKAVYRRTPLSFYAGRLLYKVMEDEDLTEEDRTSIVEKAFDAMALSTSKQFKTSVYTCTYLYGQYCEYTCAQWDQCEVLHAVRHVKTVYHSSTNRIALCCVLCAVCADVVYWQITLCILTHHIPWYHTYFFLPVSPIQI